MQSTRRIVPSAILRRFRPFLDGLRGGLSGEIGFDRAAVYAAHGAKWHRVVELVLVSAVGNVLMIHFWCAEWKLIMSYRRVACNRYSQVHYVKGSVFTLRIIPELSCSNEVQFCFE